MENAAPATAAFLGVPLAIWGTWFAGLLTLAVFSFLYSDNPIYKAAEHLFVGVSAAYGIVIYWHDFVVPRIYQPLFNPAAAKLEQPKYILLIPVAFGVLILTRYIPRIDWLSRWPIAVSMGAGAGLSIPVTVQGVFFKHMHATMKPIWPVGDVTWAAALGNFLILLGIICTLTYFYFSLPHKGVLKGMSRVGMWYLMIAFGAAFGNTVMARVSLLIGRVQFLLYKVFPTLQNPFGP